jgi:hypothetical protein
MLNHVGRLLIFRQILPGNTLAAKLLPLDFIEYDRQRPDLAEEQSERKPAKPFGISRRTQETGNAFC